MASGDELPTGQQDCRPELGPGMGVGQPAAGALSLAPGAAPCSMPPHEPSSLLPSPSAEATPAAQHPLKQHASALLAPAGDIMWQEDGPAVRAAGQVPDGANGTSGSGGAARPAAPLQRPPAQVAVPAQGAHAAGSQQQQQQQQQPAAAGAAPPAAQSPGASAAADLEAILGRIMQLDVEGWFRNPVPRAVPNYYKIIKRPMCFEVMRSKIRSRQYVNWQEVVRDFELICSNAMKFNLKRSRVHKQALIMLRAGKKLLLEVEQEGRRAMAAMVAAGLPAAAPAPVQLMPADSQAVPSSLYRSGTAGGVGSAALLRSQSTADTATTEAESDMAPMDGLTGPAEDGADPAGYSSYEATDMEDDDPEDAAAAARQQAARLLDAAARDAVLAQPWAWLPAAAQQQEQQPAAATAQERLQRDQQQPAAAAAAQAVGHSQEWKAARRGVEWRVRWLEHRLTELHHQRERYRQLLAAEAEREAARPQRGEQAPAAAQQQQQQQQQQGAAPSQARGAGADKQAAAAQPATAAARQSVAPPPAVKAEDGAAAPAAAAAATVARPPLVWHHRPHKELGECQLPGLLQHPFIAAHSVLGARQQGGAGSGGGQQLPAVMDGDDFPAEVHAALDVLDQKLSSLRRQLVAMQRPTAQVGLQRVSAVRVPGYRANGVPGRRGSGFTPRSGGVTPRGTPRSGSTLYRDPSLGKRRRVPEYDVGELITPLGAPKFVERAQVKTIDTPRVRLLPQAEVKKRQAAFEAYTAQRKQGKEGKEAFEAIDALCPGESSSEEDTSDEAYLARHEQMEAEERARYEAVLGAAVKKNKQQSKVSKDRSKQPGSARSVARTASAPAMVGTGAGTPATAAAVPPPPLGLASPAASMLPGALSAPAVVTAASAPSSAAPSPAAGSAAPTPASAPAALSAPTPASADAAQGPARAASKPAHETPAPAAKADEQPQSQHGSQPAAGSEPGQASASAAAVPTTVAPGTSLPGSNGLPLMMPMPLMNMNMNAAMAAQMAQMAAMATSAGQGSGKQGTAAAATAGAGSLLPPFGLTPAMAAAMMAAGSGGLTSAQQAAMRQAGAAMALAAASAADPLAGLPSLQAMLPPNGTPAQNGGTSSGSRGRGRPRGVRPRR